MRGTVGFLRSYFFALTVELDDEDPQGDCWTLRLKLTHTLIWQGDESEEDDEADVALFGRRWKWLSQKSFKEVPIYSSIDKMKYPSYSELDSFVRSHPKFFIYWAECSEKNHDRAARLFTILIAFDTVGINGSSR